LNYQGDHTVPLHLAPELRSGLIKYMEKHDLDKQFAALCLLTKSLRSEGLLSEEAYNFYMARYSKTVSSMSPMNQQTKPLTLDELKVQQKLDEKTRYFQAILKGEWTTHPSPEWRKKVLVIADEWKDRVPQARLVLDLGGGQK
jgi:hypothetical protein